MRLYMRVLLTPRAFPLCFDQSALIHRFETPVSHLRYYQLQCGAARTARIGTLAKNPPWSVIRPKRNRPRTAIGWSLVALRWR